MSPQMLTPLSVLIAANPALAGVAYFSNSTLFDAIIQDDLVIRETFEAGDSTSADGQTVFCDTPLTVRLSYSNSTSPFILNIQEEGEVIPGGFGYDTTLPDGEGTFLQVSGGAESGSWNVEFDTPGEMAAFGFTMTGFSGGKIEEDAESGFLVEFLLDGVVVDLGDRAGRRAVAPRPADLGALADAHAPTVGRYAPASAHPTGPPGWRTLGGDRYGDGTVCPGSQVTPPRDHDPAPQAAGERRPRTVS